MYEAERAALARRQAVAKALQEQAIQPRQMTQAGGFVVPYGGEFLTQAANQLGADRINREAENEALRLQGLEEKRREDAIKRVLTQMQGTPQQGGPLASQEGQEYQPFQPAVEPDIEGAMFTAAADPALGDGKGMQSVLAAIARQKGLSGLYGGNQIQWVDSDDPAKRGAYTYNKQTGKLEMIPGTQGMTRDTYGYGANYQRSLGNEQAKADKAREIAYERKMGIAQAEKEIDMTAWKAKITTGKDRVNLLRDVTTQVLDDVSWYNAGLMNQLTGFIGGTPANNLNAKLATIKAVAGFEELRQLKDMGGTLGQVSNFENQALQSVWANVEAAQSPAALREALMRFAQQAELSWSRIQEQYRLKYGEEYNPNRPAGSKPQSGGTGGQTGRNDGPPEGVDAKTWEYMTPEERSLWQK